MFPFLPSCRTINDFVKAYITTYIKVSEDEKEKQRGKGTKIFLSLDIHELNIYTMKFAFKYSASLLCLLPLALKTNHSNVFGRQMNFNSMFSDFQWKNFYDATSLSDESLVQFVGTTPFSEFKVGRLF